jgi:hypothetical protein
LRLPAHENVQERQRFVGTWRVIDLAIPDHKYDYPISPRLTAVAAASHHLNDAAIDINAAAETLLTVVEPCEQLTHVMLLILTTI